MEQRPIRVFCIVLNNHWLSHWVSRPDIQVVGVSNRYGKATEHCADLRDPYNWANQFSDDDFSNIQIWQEMCPIYMESLVQLTLGGPTYFARRFAACSGSML